MNSTARDPNSVRASVSRRTAVVQFTADERAVLSATVLPGSPRDVNKLRASDNSVATLTESGDLWVFGAAFGKSQWGTHSSGVLDFEERGTAANGAQYAGMSMLTANGAVVEHHSDSKGNKHVKTVPGLAGVTIVSLSAADGFYQAMDSTGRIWIWAGNADGSITSPKMLGGQPTSTAAMSAFGIHTSSFYGYGIGIAAAACSI